MAGVFYGYMGEMMRLRKTRQFFDYQSHHCLSDRLKQRTKTPKSFLLHHTLVLGFTHLQDKALYPMIATISPNSKKLYD